MIGHSGLHWSIQLALAGHERSFAALEKEMDEFQPLPLEAFEKRATAMWSQMRPMNPSMSDADLRRYIDNQIAQGYAPEWQRFYRFSETFVSERVSITVLAHAFTEALINAILAIGFTTLGKGSLFGLIEQAKVKDKWLIGPHFFLPTYSFEKGGKLYGDLSLLCQRRNSYTHSKATVSDAMGNIVMKGSEDPPVSLTPAERKVIRRFIELPIALHRHFCKQVADPHLRRTFESLVEQNPLAGWNKKFE